MSSERGVDEPSPGRGRRVAIVVALLVAVVVAVAWAVLGMRDEGPPGADVTPSAPATQSPSPSPTPTPEPTIDPTIFESVPVSTWETSASVLMGTAESGVTVAAPAPAGLDDLAGVVVLAAWGGDASAVIGLDRATGAQVWRLDLPGVRQTACHTLGDGRRTACAVPVVDGEADHRIMTFRTETGEVLGDDTVAQTPRHIVAAGDDLIVAGSNVFDGRLMATRGTPVDIDRFWAQESPPGFVPATEYWGGYTTDEGRAAFEVSGSTMLVELATGDAQVGRADGEGILRLWPGGVTTRTNVTDPTDRTATTTLTRPDGTVLTVPGFPWDRLGSSDAMQGVFGADDTAYDALTAAELWTASEPDDALSTAYLVVDDTVVQTSTYEESAQLVGLDLRTGAEAWSVSASLFTQDALHGRVLVLGSTGELTAIDVETGASLWQLAYPDTTDEESYGDDSVRHAVLGDALVTVSHDTVRGYSFS